jgi:hypothetical protein
MLKTLNFIRKLNKNRKKSDLVKNFPIPGRKVELPALIMLLNLYFSLINIRSKK